MASLSFTHFLSLSRWNSNSIYYPAPNLVQPQDFWLQNKWCLSAKKNGAISTQEEPSENGAVVKKKASRTTRRTPTRTRKKAKDDVPEENSELVVKNHAAKEESTSRSSEANKKTQRSRKKVASASTSVDEQKTEKKVRRRRTKKKDDSMEEQQSESEISDIEDSTLMTNSGDESEEDLELHIDEGEDISYTYGWPPLVCCFGAAQHAFVPSGRPANRLVDYEIHERMKDAIWAAEKFVRAPGGSAGSVALALASLGGKVAFMGKLGDDDYGQAMLCYLNVNNVQTRSLLIDSRRATAVSQMKVSKRGRLRMTSLRSCAEDSLSKSEINIDVLKEAKMFYFSTHSLLDRNMRSTTLKAIKMSKKLGGVIFYDVNLPLPLWQSDEETKIFIQEAWNLADVIEVTKQELEFLCGIKPTEEFDTKNNARSKFIHYDHEVVEPLWHENLKVLFVTNGTSKIHYYTKEQNGAAHGMEDAPITPFTCDMSASGDGIVAALLRMLTVQPDLITDKGYLECTIKYAIDCGVIDQWLVARTRGFPPREGIEKEGEEEEAVPDLNGIRSVTEREYRTLVESIDGSLSHANVYCHSLISFDYPGQKIGAAMGRVGKCSPFIYLVYVKQSRHAAPHFTRMASQ
ncbi:PREDICTED: fructokinase-like 2, chloroplastic isoform X1 [Theobroma cacao]|uniref:Fructokinase-like 2, chloroplastic isoform X1 n=1 Tax=Theobroma cacao TaxID=3641 RepID=A0AB32VL21_THECC|nr:PREDICTED: fructokinase-like 2, chloroplastic isoform X1 [Theobroma cacao]